MGKSSGSERRTFPNDNFGVDVNIKNPRDLATIKDNSVYKEMKQGISRYHSVLGVRERSIKLADLPMDIYGVQSSYMGENAGIYLNARIYDNLSKKGIKADVERKYNSGWSTRTNKPIQHTITHELAHATWNSNMKSAKALAASKEINKLGLKWLNDKKKKGYGKYAESNINEFWAEVVAKAVHGTPDYYTRSAKAIVKKYKL